ncbi:MAG: S8 family peptidase [Wenzhouxiangella sp.]
MNNEDVVMWSRCLLLLVFLLPPTVHAGAAHIDSLVYQALQQQGQAQIVIVFEPDHPASLAINDRSLRRASVQRTADSIVQVAGTGFDLSHRFELISALYGRVDSAGLAALERHPRVRSIGLDAGGSGHNDVALPLLGIDYIQAPRPQGLGLLGAGVKVVVLDSGIDADHPAFQGALQAEACFCFHPDAPCCPNGQSTQVGPGAAADDHGHGTWVSGQIVGRGVDSPIGVAPAADLVAVKMLNANNSFWSAGDIAASYEWVALNHPDAAVLNASLGTFATTAQQCDQAASWTVPISQAAELLTANGTVLVASTGNQGLQGIQVPSCLGDVIAVGATWKQDTEGAFDFSFFPNACPEPQVDPRLDEVACFSNTAPILDLLAPGVLMKTTSLGGGELNGVSGTSFAAPLVAGCVALIRESFPNETPQQIRERLLRSPVRVVDPRNDLEFPRLDCLDAIERLFSDRFELP